MSRARRLYPASKMGSRRRWTPLTETGGPAIPLRRRTMLMPFTDSRTVWLLPRTGPKQGRAVAQVLHHRALEVRPWHSPANHCPGVPAAGGGGELLGVVGDEPVDLLRSVGGGLGYAAVREVRKPAACGRRAHVPAGAFGGYEELVETCMAASRRVGVSHLLVGGVWRGDGEPRRALRA